MTTVEQEILEQELELEEQERQLRAEEATLFDQESQMVELEGTFGKRRQMLTDLANYVGEQEQNLLDRAGRMGTDARNLVEQSLSSHGSSTESDMAMGSGEEERIALLERRQASVAERFALAEDRRGLYATREEAVENAEAGFAKLEQRIMGKERAISDTLRKLITGAAEFAGGTTQTTSASASPPPKAAAPKPVPVAVPVAEPVPEPVPVPVAEPTPVPEPAPAPEPVVQLVTQSSEPDPDDPDSFVLPIVTQEELDQEAGTNASHEETKSIAGSEPVKIVSGSSEGQMLSSTHVGPYSAAEDAATDTRDAQLADDDGVFEITLEVDLADGSGSAFFRYSDDSPDELPGLFLATEQRLKVDRRVSLSIRMADIGTVETSGIVSYLHDGNEEEGPNVAGMYIEIVDLDVKQFQSVTAWMENHAPIII